MKKIGMGAALAVLVSLGTVIAEEQAPAAAPAPQAAPPPPAVKREKPPLQDLELAGRVVQVEKIQKNKDGTETKKMVTVLDIPADDTQVVIPQPKKGVDPIPFVGKEVKVFGKGSTIVNPKTNKKTIRLIKVDKIEPVQ